MNNNTKNGVKRVVVIVFAGLILAVLTWIGRDLVLVKGELKVLKAGVDVEVLKTEIEMLKERINEKTVNRYKGSDAREDFARVNEHIKDMELRLRSLERGR